MGRATQRPLLSLVGRFAGSHSPRFAAAVSGTFFAQVFKRVPALVIGVALDSILLNTTAFSVPLVPDRWLPTTTAGQVSLVFGVLASAVVLEGLLSWLAGRVAGTAQLRTLHDIRTASFDAVVSHEMRFFDDRQTGDILSVLNNDVNNVRTFSRAFFRGLRFLGQIVVAFLFMFALNWQLALVLLALPVVLVTLSHWYTTAVEPRYDAVRRIVGEVNARLEDSIDGIATVKAFGREDYERDAIESVSRQYRDNMWDVIRLRLTYNVTSWLVSDVIVIGVFALGAHWVMAGPPGFFSGTVTVGTLLTFLLYSKSFYFPVRQLVLDILDTFENAQASSRRIVEVLTDAPDDVEFDTTAELAVSRADVAFEGVGFAYDGADEPTVSDVSFRASSGDLVGIVGPSGAGKSTVLKLLFRFYDPDDGTITVDGTDTSTVSPRSVRAHLGYVSQDPFLFYGTVRENIAYATPDLDEEAIVDAARRAGAHDFVEALPEGYDTQVGERGESLSGGQRQRIAIARALARDPAVLVLDEATSHVDNETERHIQRSIDELSGAQTTFAIAHRLSTIRDADRILVLDDGEIAERGTHAELVAEDGLYADLWRVQVGSIEDVSGELFGASPRATETVNE